MTVVARGSPGEKTPPPGEDGDAGQKQDRVRPVLQTNPGLKDPAGRAVEGTQIQKLVQSNLMTEDRATAREGCLIDQIDQENTILRNPDDRATAEEANLIDQIDQGNMILTNSEVLEGRADHVNPNDTADLTAPHLENPEVLEGGSGSVNADNNTVPTDPKIIENHIATLVSQNLWDEVEAYVVKIINADDPLALHPVLFLHIRRSKLLHFIDTKRFDEAGTYFTTHVKGPFDRVIKLGQEKLPFASVRYLKREINYCGSCVRTNDRKKHYHGDPEIMQHVICDYFRVNVPSKIRDPTNHKMWQFGIRVATPPGNRKASFRCMVCQHVFNQESIGLLQRHLKSCFMMNTQYLDELFEACCSKFPEDRVRAKVPRPAEVIPPAQDAASSQVNVPVVQKSLSVKDCVLLFRENLEAAQTIKTKISEDQSDPTWAKLLGTALANVEVYGNMIISSLGPEVMAAPPAPNPITQLAITHSGPIVPEAASAQGIHLAVLQSGPTVRVAPSAQPNLGTELTVAQSGQVTSGLQTAEAHQRDAPASLPSSAAPQVAGHPLQAGTESAEQPLLNEGLGQGSTEDNTLEATSAPSLLDQFT